MTKAKGCKTCIKTFSKIEVIVQFLENNLNIKLTS